MTWLINEPTSDLFYTQMKYMMNRKMNLSEKVYDSKIDRRVGDRLYGRQSGRM